MKHYILAVLLSFVSLSSIAQQEINGQVISRDNDNIKPLPYAQVQWLDSDNVAYADSAGYFTIMHHSEEPLLVVSYIGFKTDTFHIFQMNKFLTIELVSDQSMDAISITIDRLSYGLSSRDAKFTIELDEREFQKAACCNLSESFENAPAIDVSIGDAVTGTKQIKMLGLDGFYTLISKEYMPSVRALNSYYGMSFIPAAWVKSIQITKGAGSIVNGYESIAGQINVELKTPFDDDKFMLDQFVSQAGRAETDVMYRWDINKYVATSAFAHVAYYPGMMDNNNDGFMDMPSGEAASFYNRWKFYTPNNLEGQFNLSYTNDNKRSGQREFFTENNKQLYGVDIFNEGFDVTAKLGKFFPSKPYKSFGSQYQFSANQHKSVLGSESVSREYIASSKTYYANLMYQSIFGHTFHTFQTGLSVLADEMTEQLDSFQFNRTEIVPGAFMEYTYKPRETFNLVGGIRVDYNSIYGLLITPRFHGKYRFNEGSTSVRASAGLGRHTSNIIAQNQFLLASQRRFEILESDENGAYGLQQEVAINSGVSIEHQFKLAYFPATFIADYFHTSFVNEVVVDRETEGLVRFYNMDNGTRSHSLQLQLDVNPLRRTELRFAYRMFDVQTTYLDLNQERITMVKPFVSKHRAFVNITQKTRNKWQFSSTVHWVGPQRIAGAYEDSFTTGISDELTPIFSDSYFTVNLQVSKQFKQFPIELYLGAENLLNFQQPDPIINAQNPFAQDFDAGMVWGPIFGRMVYGGFRWRIKSNYNENLKQTQ